MKRVLVTQRCDFDASRGEWRDSLDKRWADLLQAANVFPVLVPNNLSYVSHVLATETFDGLLLTGGASLADHGGPPSDRDAVELHLLEASIRSATPVLGVCRGMQVIQHYYNHSLGKMEGHAGATWALTEVYSSELWAPFRQIEHLRFYHELGCLHSHLPLLSAAITSDKVVVALQHVDKPVFGIMWHPEREVESRSVQIEFLQKIFHAQT